MVPSVPPAKATARSAQAPGRELVTLPKRTSSCIDHAVGTDAGDVVILDEVSRRSARDVTVTAILRGSGLRPKNGLS